MKRRDKVQETHTLKSEGYADSQVAEIMGISRRTVRRLLHVNPEYLCVDGTQTRQTHKLLDPYREQIQVLIERGFKNWQILEKLKDMLPGVTIKRTTLGDFCHKLRTELFEYTKVPQENIVTPGEDSILFPYIDKVTRLLDDNKPITVIFATIKAEGYLGSYSLLQQYCLMIKSPLFRTKKSLRKIKRRDLTTAVWSGSHDDLTETDMLYIENNYPVLGELRKVVSEFRESYSKKDVDAVKSWCAKYSECGFPAICSFIKGVNADTDAFYNSMKYEYSNGLLEGCVNKLKAVKRSMFGRASYTLLRAKLLLANDS